MNIVEITIQSYNQACNTVGKPPTLMSSNHWSCGEKSLNFLSHFLQIQRKIRHIASL